MRDWLSKRAARLAATVDVTVEYRNRPLRYRLAFTETGSRFQLSDEAVENECPLEGRDEPYFYYRYQEGDPVLNVFTQENSAMWKPRRLKREDVKPEQSILSQRRDPDSYPELTYLAANFKRMRFYREWNFGRFTPARMPQLDLRHYPLRHPRGRTHEHTRVRDRLREA